MLDIGLPNLNGIDAAKQIRQVVPDAKVLFLTLINDADVPLMALNSGGHGYVLKSDAGSGLLPAIEAVLRGEQYVSTRLVGHDLTDSKDKHPMAGKKIEIFSAGCGTCKETIEMVMRLAGSTHQLVVHDMHKSEVARKAKEYGVRSVPAVVIDGKLAGCCAGRGPDEHVLRSALS